MAGTGRATIKSWNWFIIDPSTGQPHIHGHNVTETQVEDVLSRPIEDRPGSEGSRVALGQAEAGRYLKVIYVPDPATAIVNWRRELLKHPTRSRSFRPTWTAVKNNLRQLNTDGLVDLLHDLYQASPDNQRFLHGRLLGSATELGKYRELISEAVFPNPLGRKPVRIAEAQRLVRHYEQATGDVVGTVDLLLTFVAAGTDQAADLGYGDDAYFAALRRALESAVKLIRQLGADDLERAQNRLQWIRNRAASTGYGFSDVVDECTKAVLGYQAGGPRKSQQPRSNKALEPSARA